MLATPQPQTPSNTSSVTLLRRPVTLLLEIIVKVFPQKHTIFFGDDDFQIGWGSNDVSIVG